MTGRLKLKFFRGPDLNKLADRTDVLACNEAKLLCEDVCVYFVTAAAACLQFS